MRIVSLLPSATEFICALGLREQLVGVSHECDYPETVAGLPVVTRSHMDTSATSREIDAQVRQELDSRQALYSLQDEVLAALEPDLIVTQSLCDVCAVAEADVSAAACRLPGAPAIFNLQPMNLADVLATTSALAAAAAVPAAGDRLHAEMSARIDAVRARSAALPSRMKPKVVFLEWIDPPFNAGHWAPELIEIAGGRPQLGAAGEPSGTITWDAVAAAAPDHIVIGCCGFDIARTRREIAVLQQTPDHPAIAAFGAAQVSIVDGNAYFNRPGPRLVDSLELVAHVLHPALHPLPGFVTPAVALQGPPHD